MEVELSQDQAQAIIQCTDVALKSNENGGVQLLQTAGRIVNVINTQFEQEEEVTIYELEEEDVQAITTALDITLREEGMSSVNGVVQLMQLLEQSKNNDNDENKEE